ncbi:MAG: NrfD/PsrC family molybdoenzyme membrane anchor subunit [Anaerolineae bacterium]
MTWEWPIAIDLWVAGMAGGAYFAAFLIDRISGRKHPLLPKIAMFLGVPLVLLGSLLLVVDLGEQLRAWHLFTRVRPGSAMSMGSWILLVYALIGIVMIALWWSKSFEPGEVRLTVLAGLASVIRPAAPVIGVLSWIALVLAVLLMSYTGVLLSATNQPLWASTFLLPVLFVASAIFTGTALLLLVLKTGLGRLLDILFGGEGEPIPSETMDAIGKAMAIVGVVQLVVLIAYVGGVALLGTPTAASAVATMTAGPLSFLFWAGVVLVGLLIPLGLQFASMKAKREAIVGSVLTSTSLVLIGGFILRLVVVLGGQMI